MSAQNRDNNLVEHMLNLLNLFQSNQIEVEQLIKSGDQTAPALLSGFQNIETVYEMIKFMDEMPGGFLIYHADGDEQIIYGNKGLLQIFQCETMKEFRKLTQNSFRGMVHPEDLEEVEHSIKEQVFGTKQGLDHVEYRIIRKDGEVRWIEDYGHFIHSEAVGDIFYVFLGDITEKKSRQMNEKAALAYEKRLNDEKLQNVTQAYDKERLLLNQEHLRELEVIKGLSMNYESIFYADLDKDKIMPYRLSSRTKLQFGEKFQMRDLTWYISSYVNTWVHPEDRETVLHETSPEHIREKLSGSSSYHINYRTIENGDIQYLQLCIVNVGPEEQASQIVMGYRRIDDELKQEIEQKQILAEALNNAALAIDAKNTFLSNMSHDMRTPLNAIFGFITLAKRNIYNTNIIQEYLNRIEASGRQLLDLIDKVLEISWAESNEAHVEENECSLCSIMQEIHEFLLPQAIEKNITFSLDCTGVIHSDIYGDEQRIKQFVMYLANNAVTYTKPGGRVSMAVTEQERLSSDYAAYRFVFEDTGIGISQDFLKRIFEPFTREKNTTLSGIHGVGLGLAIAKNIVDMMGGTIEAKSAVNEGSTFTIILRLRIQHQRHSPSSDREGAAARSSIRRILLVEDNELNLEIETEILQELGFFIETACNGSIAVEMVKGSSPGYYDLILMDIQMPVMDGWEAARAIRRLENPALAHIPIVALSANVFESDKQISMESGMEAHLTKPMDIPVLLETIESLSAGLGNE
ncbi:ATP-binding protein [Lachnospiraceae bacterium 62-35]